MAALRLATRGSPLALAQAHTVRARLDRAGAGGLELIVVETTGDARADAPLREIGGEGVFTAAVDRAVAEGRADVAVHSAKDLPARLVDERLLLAAVPERADARDCLVGRRLRDLSDGATIATGSIRRQAQLAALRPDLRFVDVRGNIARRLARVPDGGAVVVALAALERLGETAAAAEVLETDLVLPQVGQGALALTCRVEDEATRQRLRAIDDVLLHRALRAERAFLATLGAGCTAPLGAYATASPERIELEALLARPDGTLVLRTRAGGDDPEVLGTTVAHELIERAGRAGLAVVDA